MSDLKTQELKYSNLWAHRLEPSLNLEVCLSEFIDNSISSFQKNLDKLENNKVLEVTIKSLYKKDGSRQIIVIDNAFGMDQKELEESIVLFKDATNKDPSSMNQFGIGLKSSIFWIGDNAEITSCSLGKTHKLTFYPLNKIERTSSTIFQTRVEECWSDNDIPNNGTKIVIDCIHKKETSYWTSTSFKKNETIKDFLGKKYRNYLKDNNPFKLVIKFLFVNELNSSNNTIEEIQYKDFNDNPLCLSNFMKNEFDRQKALADMDKVYSKIKNDYKNKKYINNTEVSDYLYSKFKNDKKLVWEDNIIINNENNEVIKIKTKFSLLSEPKLTKSGLIICHNKRYIYFPGKNKDDHYKTYNYYSDEKFIEGHHRWLSFEINLEDIEGNEKCEFIKPDKNKTLLVFDDREGSVYKKELFESGIVNYIKQIDLFIKLLLKLNEDLNYTKDANNVTKKSLKNKDSITSKTVDKIDKSNVKIEDNYIINVKFVEKINDEHIIDVKCSDENKTIDAELNLESKYIKNQDSISLALLLLYTDLNNRNKNYITKENNILNILEKISKWKNNDK